jgi:hypothetical protein
MGQKVSFERWMQLFDAKLMKELGAGHECFPDWDYWGAWDSELSVNEAYEDWREDQEQNF